MSDYKKESEGILENIGVSVFDGNGELKTHAELIPEIETALKDAGYSQAEKAALLSELFGAKWREIVNTYFKEGL